MSRQILNTTEQIQAKRERVPVHESRDKLRIPGLDHENFEYRFVNITNQDNLARLLGAWWKFVQKDNTGNPSSQHVDSFSGVDSIYCIGGGRGVTLALMCIPKELYEEDQRAKQAKVQASEDEMHRDLRNKTDPNQGNYGHVSGGSILGPLPGRKIPQ